MKASWPSLPKLSTGVSSVLIDIEEMCRRLTRLYASDLALDVASPDTDLLEAGVLDSALLVEILLLLEKHFYLQISVEELTTDDLRSIRGIARLICSWTGGDDDQSVCAVKH